MFFSFQSRLYVSLAAFVPVGARSQCGLAAHPVLVFWIVQSERGRRRRVIGFAIRPEPPMNEADKSGMKAEMESLRSEIESLRMEMQKMKEDLNRK